MPTRFKVPDNLFRPRRDYEISTPFTPAELKRTERALGVKLPAAYVAVLKVRNGGSLRLSNYPLTRRPPKSIDWIAGREYPISEFPGVHPTHACGLTQVVKTARGWGVDDGLIALAGDGHWWACLDYRKCGPRGEPSVTHWEQGEPGQRGRTFPVARSFAQLISGLRRAGDDFEPATIALDHAQVRGEHLAKILKALGCTEHRYPGVRSSTPLPPTWHWPRYRSFVRGLPACLTVEKNKTYGYAPKFDQRKAGHPMLRISVKPNQAAACLDELTAALGPNAALLAGVI